MRWLSKEEKLLERSVLREISSKEMWRHIKWLSDNVPERLAGTEEARKATEYFRKTLESYGVPVEVYEFDGYVSFPGKAELRLLSPERRSFECRAYAHIASTPKEGIEGELVYVRSGGLEDYRHVDAKGKITLAELSYAPPRPEKVRIAELNGSIGQIQMNWGKPDSKGLPLGTVKRVWGNPTPESIKNWPSIPAISISKADGMHLKSLCEKGKVRVWLRAEATKEWRRISQPVATIKGTAEPQKFVLVGGHFDAWGGGVTCNATGNTLVLELARILNKHRDGLKRSVRLAWWIAHETGIMEGSTWYVDNFWEDLSKNCIAYYNCDSPGMIDTPVYGIRSTTEVKEFLVGNAKEVFGEPVDWRRLQKTGDQSFFGVGLPCIWEGTTFTREMIEELGGAVLGWWYHSTEDTLDKVDMKAQVIATKVFATNVLRFCNTPLLPYDFLSVGRTIEDTVAQLQSAGRNKIDLSTLLPKAKTLITEAERLKAALDEAMKTYSKMRRGKKKEELDQRLAKVNEDLMAMTRALNPMLYTMVDRYDQDTYGLSYLEKPIPFLQPVNDLAAMNPNSQEFKMLLTQLVRARNRVGDAIDLTTEIAEKSLQLIS